MFALFLSLTACNGGTNASKTHINIEQTTSLENDSLLNKTKYTYIDSTGIVYPIYLSTDRKAFIIKISKETGERYRKYLHKVTEELHKADSI